MKDLIVVIKIEPVDALAEKHSAPEIMSRVSLALYGRMGEFGWKSVDVKIFEHRDI